MAKRIKKIPLLVSVGKVEYENKKGRPIGSKNKRPAKETLSVKVRGDVLHAFKEKYGSGQRGPAVERMLKKYLHLDEKDLAPKTLGTLTFTLPDQQREFEISMNAEHFYQALTRIKCFLENNEHQEQVSEDAYKIISAINSIINEVGLPGS
jgi:uncharacterized protein (DUF4415 family)